MPPPFVELLARSCFSFVEGASHPEELVARAHELALDGVAIPDRGGLFGAVRTHTEGKRLGQRVLVGATLDVHAHGAALPVSLLVDDARGYQALCRLVTRAHADRPVFAPRADLGEPANDTLPSEGDAPQRRDAPSLSLSELAGDLEGLRVVVPLDVRQRARLPDLLRGLRDACGDAADPARARVAIATFHHGEPEDRARDELAVELAESTGATVVASSVPLAHHPSRRPIVDVLTCIRLGTTLDQAGRALLRSGEAVLRGPAEMERRFPGRAAWLEATARFAEPARFSLGELRYAFPGLALAGPGETPNQTLARLVAEGARRRYPLGTPSSVMSQLERELALIERLDVAPYFLSVHQVVEMARARRILCQGRGSAANSAVCFVLGITSVDPARSSLLFERFLSAERAEPPDIDVDFEHERREEVIQDIFRTYGRDRAAMVATVIAYRSKLAVRDVGKAFGLSLDQVDRLASVAPHHFGAAAQPLSERRVREVGLDPSDGRLQKALFVARQLEGFPRHLSIHVGGFVLSANPLYEVAPVHPAAMPGRTVVPWDKDDVDALGFFKVDVLGLGMLTAIRKGLAEVHAQERPRVAFDPIEALAAIPAEDPIVYDAISRADTIGVFQIESRAQQAMLPRLAPRAFYDLVIEVAIVRPGPIQGGMVHPYLRRRQGKEPAAAPHPCLEPILARTLGVPLFQEQVMQIAMVGAGSSAGEADQLRRDMAAWKKHGRLARHRERLLCGFARAGIAEEFGERLYQQIHGFGEYGFPESHAASFAILVYASAWLKAHHPAAFVLALLNSQPMGFYSPSSLVQDAARHGVEVRPPDVVASEWDTRLESNPHATVAGPVRLGLRLVRGLGREAGLAIVRARSEGMFSSIADLASRAALDRKALDALAEAGALGTLEPDRRRAMWAARAPRVGGLFEGLEAEGAAPPALSPVGRAEQLVLDYDRVGLSVGDHPMAHLRASLKRVVRASELPRRPHGARVRVAGLVIGRQRPATASGITFVTLEDETGMVNLVVRPAVYERFHAVASRATLLVASGKLEREGGAGGGPAVVHVLASSLEALAYAAHERPLASRSRDFH